MSDAERETFRPVLPRKHQGPRRAPGRRVMDGIFFVPAAGTPWRGLPERCGPCTTCSSRYNRRAGTAHGRRSWRNSRSLRAMTTGTTTARPARFACAWRIHPRRPFTGTAPERLGTPRLRRSGRAAAGGRPRPVPTGTGWRDGDRAYDTGAGSGRGAGGGPRHAGKVTELRADGGCAGPKPEGALKGRSPGPGHRDCPETEGNRGLHDPLPPLAMKRTVRAGAGAIWPKRNIPSP